MAFGNSYFNNDRETAESLKKLYSNFEGAGSRTRASGANIVRTARFLRGGSILDNTLTGKNKIVNGLDDPSYLGFIFQIPPSKGGLFGTDETASVNTLIDRNYEYSALAYLKNCVGYDEGASNSALIQQLSNYTTDSSEEFVYDESLDMMVYNPNYLSTETYTSLSAEAYNTKGMIFPREYVNLHDFVHGMRMLCNNYPYVFQSVEGLQEAYKKYFGMAKDPLLGGGDNKIKINCLESVDLRMTALFDAYFNAVYDRKYMRWLMPTNLMEFDCEIIIHDIRNFSGNSGLNNVTGNIIKNIDAAIANMSTVVFTFKDCTFNVEEIGESFASVSNAETSETKFSFVFDYGNLDVQVFSLADILDGRELENKNEILDSNHLNRMFNKSSARRYFDIGDSNVYKDNGLGIGEAMLKLGEQIYNSATSSSKLGNAYDNSKLGLVSSALSTISGASVSNILASLAHQGNSYIGEKIMENRPSSPFNNFVGNMFNL